jgi:membrane fusion protein (multidrug efflux system)
MNRYERQQSIVEQEPPRRRLWLWIPVVALATIAVFVLAIGFPIGAFVVKGFPAPPPTTVTTAIAAFETWHPQIQAVGSLKPVHGADLSFEVSGIVAEVDFDSGGDVAEGAKLIRLVDSDEIAKLHTLEASRDLWQANYDRDQQQLQRQLISKAQFDITASNLKQLQAQIAEQQAIVNKKMLRAPFEGHLGIRNVNVGQYIAPGTVVVTLQALDPIFFDFSLPQQLIDQIKVGQTLTLKVDAYPDATFTGEITTIDPKVDPATRNVSVRATLPNKERKLLPGMYATANVSNGETERYITLPQTAITFNPYGNMVYLVQKEAGSDGKEALVAKQVVVTTGETRGDQIAVLTGLKEGDQVVSSGQLKLQNGSQVAIDNTIQPSNDPNPRPVER